jgi:hypothetical protein
MTALMRTRSSFQRGSLSMAFVIALAAAVEWESINRGSSVASEIAFLAIPAMASIVFFQRWRSRVAAWVLLTMLSYATSAAVVVGYWYWAD